MNDSSSRIVPPPAAEHRAKMVGWFDPGPLVGVATKVLVSTLFGRHSDYRLVEALSGGAEEYYDYSRDGERQRDEIWIDYIADTGDGFDSTYAIAYWLTRPTLEGAGPDGAPATTHAGDILIFGGDEVYPSASRADYHARLVRPFETARNYSRAPEPHAFAIPGNHDWYDSLVSFTRLFCSGRWFQGWRTRQRRSYFALKLPQGFWLIGADVQLGSDIDALQVDYFKKVAAQMQPGDRVIVCTAEPHWVYSVMYEEFDPEANEKNTQYLERVLQRRGASVVLYLAGDLHHYRRHEGPDGTQKITAGGGGAFLHPTHGLDASELAGGYRLKRAFPDEATSRRLCWRNLAFPAINPRFGVVAGSIYAFLGWSAAQQGLGRILGIAVLLMGFVLFTDTHSKWYRRVGGTIHGLVHTAAAFGLLAIARSLTAGMGERILVPELVTAAVLFFGGGLLGSWILGLYLLVSLNGFGRHSNEAFSALRIPDFKNFIRLHIDPSGRLSIFPFGIERVPRRWRAATGATEFDAQLEPDDPRATPPRSVEPAVTLARRGGA